MSINQHFFATCPKGLEALLRDELTALGADDLRETIAGVSFTGELALALKVCLWSRMANKVLLPVAKFAAANADDLYRGICDIDWSEHLAADGSLWIDFSGTGRELRNTQFAAQKVKDAIVDQLRTPVGSRPSVSKDDPDLTVNVRLNKEQVTVNIDLCGHSLHRRGYRADSVKAPLKENLAAALLLRAGWPDLAEQGLPLIDPMCGSGTLLLEAAFIAADIAPGLARRQFAFERWLPFIALATTWQQLKAEAEQRKTEGLQKSLPDIIGYDQDVLAVRASERNIAAAGLGQWIKVWRKSLLDFKRPTHKTLPPGLLITNPPYGERLNDEGALVPLYRRLGEVLKSDFVGWRAAVFTGNPKLGKVMGIRSHKKYKLFNGAIATELLLFDVSENYFVSERGSGPAILDTAPSFDARQPLSPGAQMVANRLQKNKKQLAPWLREHANGDDIIECYRLYDADIPEYAAAVDVYGDYYHVQEYAPPKSVDPDAAARRFEEIIHALVVSCEVTPDHVSIKQRKRLRGNDQYQALTDDPFAQMLEVREGPARLWVNLWAYLDTGLFLDHRPLRRRVAALAQGKRFLNLFCYTASVTVQAIRGGAAGSVSVDLSNTYLQWARRNFKLNDVDERKHRLVQADCFAWLKACREPFDIILLDPPTFSNSKRMDGVLDVQRDHVALICRCMELLSPGGKLFFSTNLRRFKLDNEALIKYEVKDISKETIDRDFQRSPKIHRCWEIQLK